jgi:hypothetical protein
MHELIKKYKTIFLVIVPILILALIRSLSSNHFKSDAKKWAEPSLMQSNIITPDKYGSLTGNFLIIHLDTEKNGNTGIKGNEVEMLPDEILQSENLKRIKKNDGPVLLSSTDPAISSRIWMILSQLGCKNIFILPKEADNEVLKYKFRTDSIISPER